VIPRRVGRHIGGGPEPEGEREQRERRDALREAWSRWTSGVTILATRAAGGVHALTVSSFFPLSLDPPLVLASLGPNASALPYLDRDSVFAISILKGGQQGLATRFADPFPVGPDPFPAEGAPVIDDALVGIERGDHTLVVGRVEEVSAADEGPALAYFRRAYHTID
jgi:flavin reductase (DIM6/NTAB) family NADH-FMN oxidoreductase RutF